MNQNTSNHFRILALAPNARGFGFAVMEGENLLVAFGNKETKGNKNLQSVKKIEKLVDFYRPDIAILLDMKAKGSRRSPRIKILHSQILDLVKKRKLKTALLSTKQVRNSLLDNPKGTKFAIATTVAAKFPAELSLLLPPKRRPWDTEHCRMGIFDAIALAVAFQMMQSTDSSLSAQAGLTQESQPITMKDSSKKRIGK